MPFQEGNKLGGRKFGSKGKTTLLKEERRAIFDREVSQTWNKTIKQLKAEYIADQFMGKAPDELKVSANIVVLPSEVIKKNDLNTQPSAKDNS